MRVKCIEGLVRLFVDLDPAKFSTRRSHQRPRRNRPRGLPILRRGLNTIVITTQLRFSSQFLSSSYLSSGILNCQRFLSQFLSLDQPQLGLSPFRQTVRRQHRNPIGQLQPSLLRHILLYAPNSGRVQSGFLGCNQFQNRRAMFTNLKQFGEYLYSLYVYL
ncbi:hypothetical protein BU16DRAFT_357543 [Lophium mytilinum]|uniref:Uncharacterized protein n=1 Tax=Lophium mytilinum TaxID=390894 RepID=A0A6A6QTV2_9PEZI|nr:hypothetical protein BU16DRAFT_357543 [Lophium mytilinum]